MMHSEAHEQQPAVSTVRLLSREAIFCSLLFCFCLLLIWPVAEIGINDDWVYTLITFDFARTGHFIFHGWASPMLGWQAVWGAAFARLFGPSFTAVRLSMIPIAVASVLLYYAILRRFGLNIAHATFGTLAFAIGPLFLPLSATFMTDVPSLFAIFLCLYLCQLAIASQSVRNTLLWLTAAALTNLALGTVRQIAWLGVLVIVPSCAWLLRRRRYVLVLTGILWLLSALCIQRMLHWFAHQPYSAPESLLSAPVTLPVLGTLALWLLRSALEIALLSLPFLVLGATALRSVSKRQALRVAVGLILFALTIAAFRGFNRAHVIEPPWLGPIGNVVGATGFIQGGVLFGSARSVPDTVRLLVFAVFVVVCLFFGEALAAFRGPHSNRRSDEPELERQATAVLLIPFLIAYSLLLLPRTAFSTPFDRYFLEIVAVLIVFLLRWHHSRVSDRIPALAIVTLVLFAAVTTAGMHDLFSMDRAEVRAANELQQAGIPRTKIRGGFAFDSTTQIYAWGYINDPRILNPREAYRPQPAQSPIFRGKSDCGYALLKYVPALHVQYVITADPSPCLQPAGFQPQTYWTWLPPARREVSIGAMLPISAYSSVPQ